MDLPTTNSGLRTSFIPKASLAGAPKRREGSSFLTFLGIVVLFVSLLGWLAAYGYKSILEKDVKAREISLTNARESFDPTLLKTFENLDRRLHTADDLLKSHSALPPMFSLLDELTLKAIRYTYFSYANNGVAAAVRISGEAQNFQSIALLALEYSRSGQIQNPIFSNLGVEESGLVTFDVSFNVDPALVSYVPPVTNSLDGI